MLTDCQLATQEPEETLDFDFVSSNVIGKVIMRADGLREAFSEFDSSSEIVEVLISPRPPHFRLSTFGYAGTVQASVSGEQNTIFDHALQIDHPKDSEMIEIFDCQQHIINRYMLYIVCEYYFDDFAIPFRYQLSLLKHCTKALSAASKISLRVDVRGFLSLQCMIVPEGKQVCFVEFLVTHI